MNQWNEKELRKRVRELLFAHPACDFVRDGRLRVQVAGEAPQVLAVVKEAVPLLQMAVISGERISYRTPQVWAVTPEGEAFAETVAEAAPALTDFPDYVEMICVREAPEEDRELRIFLEGERVRFVTPDGSCYDEVPEEVLRDFARLNTNQKYDNYLGRKETWFYSYERAGQERERQVREDPYLSASSEASTAHMPVRLALFSKDREEAQRLLSDLLTKPSPEREKDVRYRALTALEHRRWNAYMILDGYRAPSEEVFEAYAYRDGVRHRTGRWHPCVCDGGDDPFWLKNHPEAWSRGTKEEMSALDWFSVRAHRLCAKRAAERREETLAEIARIRDLHPGLSAFVRIANRFVLDDGCTETAWYHNVLRDAEALEGGRFVEELERLAGSCRRGPDGAYERLADGSVRRRSDGLMDLFFLRNERKDYALLDRRMIDALSFDLWHGRDYAAVVSYCGESAYEAVRLPFMMSAPRVIYLYDPANEAGRASMERIRAFAAQRGYEGITFAETDGESPTAVASRLIEVLAGLPEARRTDGVCLYCPEGTSVHVRQVFAETAAYSQELAVLAMEGDAVCDARSGRRISCGVGRQMRTSEYLKLRSALYENAARFHAQQEKLEELEEIFRRYSRVTSIGGKRNCAWSSMQDFFCRFSGSRENTEIFGKELWQEAVRDDAREMSAQTGRIECLRIAPEVCEKLRLKDLVQELTEYRVLGGTAGSWEDGLAIVSPDEQVRLVFRCLAKLRPEDEVCYGAVSFAKEAELKDLLRVTDLWGREALLYAAEENIEMKTQKRELLAELLRAGILTEVRFSDEEFQPEAPCKAICRFSDLGMKRLFQTPGKIFETLLFRKIRESDRFADVQNGVSIAWDQSRYMSLKERLEMYFPDHPGFGRDYYVKAKLNSRQAWLRTAENEVDVVMMKDLNPVFVSCKTGRKIDESWIYEIAAVAEHFHAAPVLAVSMDLDEIRESAHSVLGRAQGMGISMFGREIIFDEKRFQKCMDVIAAGGVYSALEAAAGEESDGGEF
ncbi:MAG: hypothetical protein IJU99_00555 [Lachnospiraceae bacterium]|nr:hypothetical protein [Lachnospiraceae bacterium]